MSSSQVNTTSSPSQAPPTPSEATEEALVPSERGISIGNPKVSVVFVKRGAQGRYNRRRRYRVPRTAEHEARLELRRLNRKPRQSKRSSGPYGPVQACPIKIESPRQISSPRDGSSEAAEIVSLVSSSEASSGSSSPIFGSEAED